MASECAHLGASVRPLAAPDLRQLMSVPQCDVCGKRAPNLWLCLYPDCYMLGCADESEIDHSSEHQKTNPDHFIQLNIDTRRAWCYGCKKEVGSSYAVIGVETVEKFGKVLKPKPNDQFVAKAPPEVDERRQKKRRHVGGRVGLSNLGNTCYMNAALQCLSNVPPLTEFFFRCPALVNHNNSEAQSRDKPSLSKAYLSHITDVWKTYRKTDGHYIAPSKVSFAFKMAHPMFRGFHQHDSQEFLRCFMDQMHEELMEPTAEIQSEDDDLESVSEAESNGEDTKSYQSEEQGEEPEYETADSGVSEQSSSDGNAARKRKGKLSVFSEAGGDRIGLAEHRRRQASLGDPDPSSDANSPSSPSDAELEFADAASSSGSMSPTSRRLVAPKIMPRLSAFNLHKRKQKTYRSIISDIFDGKLVSSVQCLTCDRVSMTTETFQDLSLPIPSQEMLSALRNQSASNSGNNSASNEGWLSWFFSFFYNALYGTTITLEDCLTYFFSADELKGDNMYSCEKCKKLRNGLKYSRVTVLPDTLCIHLKRFRHEFAFSSKVSTKVTFPLVDLDMSPWLHSDCISKESSYELTGIICHHGTAGGGHYTAYAQNNVNGLWYEFDDSCVTQVESASVLNAEAYVLFYRKVNDKMEQIRAEFHRVLEEAERQPSLLQFHISRQWINKFENFAEPGPIDNSDFLCRHGGVLPQKSEYVFDLCVTFAQPAWEFLQQHFGGGPPCTRLYECSQCRNDLDSMTKRETFELEEFKRLHLEFQEQVNPPSFVYCVSSSWFKQWEGFVTGRLRDAPGPIDNKGIVTTIVTRSPAGAPLNIQMLRHSSDYVQVSQDIWLLFHSIYGGGPEVIVRPNGSSQVTNVRGPTLPAITSRIRAKSLSETTSGIGSSPSSSLIKV